MNINLLQEKLIRAARSIPPSDRVPYAFEKRILARIRTEPMVDILTLWARALWRATIPCVAVMLVLGAWATHTQEQPVPATTADLGVELETTLMASVSIDTEFSW